MDVLFIREFCEIKIHNEGMYSWISLENFHGTFERRVAQFGNHLCWLLYRLGSTLSLNILCELCPIIKEKN